MLFLLFHSAVALADDWYLETLDRPQRADATAWQTEIAPTGVDVRVVRRFVDGEGWRFLVRGEGFGDQAGASEAAQKVADAIDAPVSVFRSDGRTAARVAELEPSQGATVVAEVEREDGSGPLAEAVAALNAGKLADAVRDDGRLLLAYRRTLPDGRVADHTWATDGNGAVYVQIEKVEGDVVPSRILLSGGKAWLSVAGGAWAEQNEEKARMLVDALGPTEVLPLLLQLGDAVATRREFERMVVLGAGTFDGAPTRRLGYAGDATTQPIEVELTQDARPVRIRFGEGDQTVVHEFRDYGNDKGRRLPGRITTVRGGATDVVEIDKLDPAASLPAEWFRIPG
ncbi:MAG: hypothetical protein H6735_05900 [Alphaproteobacteria bacterium]|nr:hypothetical protein [Alphaproteobacteria bacterium]